MYPFRCEQLDDRCTDCDGTRFKYTFEYLELLTRRRYQNDPAHQPERNIDR